jgi:hypothetical protein
MVRRLAAARGSRECKIRTAAIRLNQGQQRVKVNRLGQIGIGDHLRCQQILQGGHHHNGDAYQVRVLLLGMPESDPIHRRGKRVGGAGSGIELVVIRQF